MCCMLSAPFQSHVQFSSLDFKSQHVADTRTWACCLHDTCDTDSNVLELKGTSHFQRGQCPACKVLVLWMNVMPPWPSASTPRSKQVPVMFPNCYVDVMIWFQETSLVACSMEASSDNAWLCHLLSACTVLVHKGNSRKIKSIFFLSAEECNRIMYGLISVQTIIRMSGY